MIRPIREYFRSHVRDDVLLLRIDNELSPSEASKIDSHLGICSRCSVRLDVLKHASQQVVLYADRCAGEDALSRVLGNRNLLRLKLSLSLREKTKNATELGQGIEHPRFGLSGMELAFISIVLIAFAILGSRHFIMKPTKSQIASSDFLLRAENSDSLRGKAVSGVICQTVTIKAGEQVLEREIYRDVQGMRKAKQRKLNLPAEQLKQKLSTAGIAWDAPLSARDYQNWRNQQVMREEQVNEIDKNLLVLTTTTPNGSVASQSLTVRDEDFHPIARTVIFRDKQKVEIAELDYRVLPWAKVASDLFEPMAVAKGWGTPSLREDSLPVLPIRFTDSQLDEIELGARLVLNQFRADSGEQIEIVRESSGITVKGLVETDERRRELVEHLQLVPHVKTSIMSITEALRKNPVNESGIGDSQAVSVSTQPSPLEVYFMNHNRDAITLRRVSQHLLKSALTASQESRAVSDLVRRFAGKGKMTDLGNATLLDLFYTHRNTLLQSLHEERGLLKEVMPSLVVETPSAITETDVDHLVYIAEHNLNLCEELALGSRKQSRSAEAILSELANSSSDLQIVAHQIGITSSTGMATNRSQ